MKNYTIAGTVIVLFILFGLLYFKPLHQKWSSTNNHSNKPATTQESSQTDTSKMYVKITSPNGGEVFKLGDTVLLTWDVQGVPLDSMLSMELIAEGEEYGQRSGLSGISVSNGTGSAEWVVGKRWNGDYVEPGTKYYMTMLVSKTGYANLGDCPEGASFKGMCEVFWERDRSDKSFSITE